MERICKGWNRTINRLLKKILYKLRYPHVVRFDKVIYDEQEQRCFIEKIATQNIEKLKHQTVIHTANEFLWDYMLDFIFYKNPTFEEEKEWRLALSSNIGDKGDSSVSDVFFSETKFRINNNQLISYLEMDFSQIKKEMIKEIWIGPKSSVTINDILDLLNTYNYNLHNNYTCVNGEPILILHSKSSYQ